MLDRVRQTVRRYGLLVPGDKVVVGVSGGPDSLALLHSLRALQEEFGHTLHVAHLNHGLRPEAAADAEYVRNLARRWGLPVTIASRDVAAYQQEHRLSLEEAAREVRYRFLLEVATAVGASKIAVGHQADDQAETVLLNLLRGSGLTGLKAMVPQRGQVIRPLLFISRAEIEAYCRQQGLEPRQDFTNWDITLRRNKIRHQLLPFLAREFNPAIVRTLSRTAVILQEEEEILANLAQEAFARIKIRQEPGCLALDREEWLSLAPGIQRRVLRLAAASLGRKVSFNQVEGAREMASRDGTITWPGHLRVEARGTELILLVPAEGPRAITFSYPLQVPGLTPLPEVGRAIRAGLGEPPATFKGTEDEAWLDWDKLEKPLVVRNWQPGDYFRPLGLAGNKKLQDFFSDIHLPVARRHLVPLVISGRRIAWVAGFRLADDFKITPVTRLALHLQLEPWP
ncbi:Lysidine-tRNA(Ile) synthetase [Moorella glycerini]|uniref:tRNA(Ile)-lysidine synthase n=1 Tax=Neomoorella stamsii TaxID=1266720 RepID=A0A9X7J4Y3_9FIRM|nr:MULTISPECIES: tRNA lysidine(34) synthetase TilS [Moorella]PRR76920.1 tRNA(Ile)-lysidine synthase [Moorella stamsii]CEP68546.1 Lysidine-tRNA(Ile) synthetase [Moorella glycerini]